MGADNLAQFHRWQDWEDILAQVPVGVLARPGSRIAARTAKAANIYRHARLPSEAAQLLAQMPAPVWCFVNLPMVAASSSEIRARGAW
jgi:nicotinate-nucleotide adenylyltransferase